MLRYIQRRLLISIPILLSVSVLVFLMLYLVPGDPVVALLGKEALAMADAETIEKLREQYGFNDPIYIQYGRFLSKALRGDLGRSMRTSRPVAGEILSRLPKTMELALTGIVFGTLLGVLLGIVAATRQNSWIDTLSMLLALVGVSMPSFWLALLMIFLFCLRLGWLPATGGEGWKRLIMPATILSFGHAAGLARLTRSSMLEVLRQDYIVVARAKGLAERMVLYRHALKNALIPVVTVLGLSLAGLFTGTFILETVFARPGLGRLALQAIQSRDYPVVQGTVLFVAVGYLLLNLLVDISYAWLDPRIRYE